MTWEEVFAGLSDENKAAYETHTKGLKTALETERGSKQPLKDKIAELEGLLSAANESSTLSTADRLKAEQERDSLKAQLDEIALTAETAEKDRKTKIKKDAVLEVATALKFHKPEDALAFIDLEKVELDSEGKPLKVKELVEAILLDRKHLAKQPIGTPGHKQPPGNEDAFKDFEFPTL